MYEERKDKFALKDVIIQILFVGVFIFLLIWLFPMKSSVKKSFTPLYDQVFNQNVDTMKEAAITYYTTPRLPQKVGDVEKMTLSDMLEKNIILPFVDSKGNQCDLIESYVSMTKMDDEYILKVNLKCGNQEDYLLVHLGCYDYCEGDICEKEPEQPTPVEPEPIKPTPNKQYEYEYSKVTNGKWGDYSDWSEWTKNEITKTDYRDVETMIVEETVIKLQEIVNKEELFEDKEVEYIDYETQYKTESVKVGTQKVPYEVAVTKYKTEIQKVAKQVPYKVPVTKTRIVKVPIGATWERDCTTDPCQRVQKTVYKDVEEEYETTETRYKTVYEDKEVSVPYEDIEIRYKDEDVYEDKEVSYEVPVTKYKTETVSAGFKDVVTTVEVPVKVQVTYYRSRTREFISGNVETKWSKSQKDQSLLSQGYTLTGKSREVK